MRLVHKVVALACLSFAMFSAQSASAQVRTFKLDPSGQKIQFISDASLEKITGVSHTATGEIKVDPEKPAQTKADISVPVDSLRTGVELRDEHIKGDTWLDAKKSPQLKFTITKVSGIEKLKLNEAAEVTVTGKINLHGVEQNVTTKAKVRWSQTNGKDTLHVLASFEVKLEDHKISVPAIVKLKVAPIIQVNVDLHATAS